MEKITSKDNPKFKALSALMSSKKERTTQQKFVAEGLRLVVDAVRSGLVPVNVFVSESFTAKYSDKLPEICKGCKNCYEITDLLADRISDTKTPQGVFAVFDALDKNLNIDTIYNNGHFIFIVSLQDPGNVGTIIRTAEAMGLSGVIMTSDCPDAFSPKVLRSTMGSAFRIPILVCPEPCAMLDTLNENGFTTYAAVLNENSLKLGDFKFPNKAVALIGNEANGLNEAVSGKCTKTLMIPMKGSAESLNAASAANIIMWEMSK